MVRRLQLLVMVSFVALVSAPTLAQTATPNFVTVDLVTVSGATLTVGGIVEGGDAPVTRQASFSSAQLGVSIDEQIRTCKEFAFVAMSKPGQYQLRFVPNIPPSCGLVRAAP